LKDSASAAANISQKAHKKRAKRRILKPAFPFVGKLYQKSVKTAREKGKSKRKRGCISCKGKRSAAVARLSNLPAIRGCQIDIPEQHSGSRDFQGVPSVVCTMHPKDHYNDDYDLQPFAHLIQLMAIQPGPVWVPTMEPIPRVRMTGGIIPFSCR